MDLRCHQPPSILSLAMQGLLWVQAGGQAGPGGGGKSLFPPGCILIIFLSVKLSCTSHLTAESLLSFRLDQKQISEIKPGS